MAHDEVALRGVYPIDLRAHLARIERQHIEAALHLAGGEKKRAADLLGLKRTTLVEKIKRMRAADVVQLPLPLR